MNGKRGKRGVCGWVLIEQRRPYGTAGARAVAGCGAFPVASRRSFANNNNGNEFLGVNTTDLHLLRVFWAAWCNSGGTPAGYSRRWWPEGQTTVWPPNFRRRCNCFPKFFYLQLSHPEGFQTYVLNPELSKSFKSFIYLNLISKIIYFNFKNCF